MGNLWFELTGEYYKSVKKLESTVTILNPLGGFRKTNQSKCLYTINIIIFDV